MSNTYTQNIVDHYHQTVEQEQMQADHGSALEQAMTETWGEHYTRKTLHDTFFDHEGRLAYPRGSHNLLFSALWKFADVTAQDLHITTHDKGKVIDQHIVPLLGGEPICDTQPATSFNQYTGYCTQAEPMFAGLIDQIRSGRRSEDNDYAQHRHISVYHAADGTPIALRKDRADSTALLLRPVRLNNVVTLPPGMITGIGGTSTLSGRAQQPHDYATIETYLVDDAAKFLVSPVRVSPWAHPEPLDRALFGVDHFGHRIRVDEHRAFLVARIALDDFREAAQQIMELCA